MRVARQGRRIESQNRRSGGDGAFTSKRLPPAERLIQHDPEAEDVGARIKLLASDLLWRHVGHRADDGSGCCQQAYSLSFAFKRAGNKLCQSEIHHLHISSGSNHYVLRLDVAVDDPVRVRFGEGIRDLRGYGKHFF